MDDADGGVGEQVSRQNTLPFRVSRTASAARAAVSRRVFRGGAGDEAGFARGGKQENVKVDARPGACADAARLVRADTGGDHCAKGRFPQLVKFSGRHGGVGTREHLAQSRTPRAHSTDPLRNAAYLDGRGGPRDGALKDGGPPLRMGRLRVMPAPPADTSGAHAVAVTADSAAARAAGQSSAPLQTSAATAPLAEEGGEGRSAGALPSGDAAAEEAAREVFGSGHAENGRPAVVDGVLVRTRRWLVGRFARA
jgi:hypothetical protein